MRIWTALILAALAAPAVAQTSPAAVIVKGEAGQVVTLTAADLAALPQGRVSLSHNGATVALEGARLDAVLAKAGAPLGPAMRGPALSDVVLVKAADGYRIVLALSDVDPAVRPEAAVGPVILATTADGKPLGKDGPFRLAVGGDLKPARAARTVVEIDVLRLP
jgi:DMSO/TMAO reductase YedYZ molybdopterin-dependent catalytic subunit